MSALSNAAENALLLLLFNNVDWENIGDAGGILGSVTAGVFYLSLHTSDPEAGDQTTSEISYTGYARVSVVRTDVGFTVTNDGVTNAAEILFGEMTAGAGGTVTFVGLGTDETGAGNLIAKASCNRLIEVGIIPRISAGALNFTAA